MPHRASRRERQKAERRHRLFEAAMDLFVARGVDETTVDEITDRADLARATFFNLWGTKEAVLVHQHGEILRGVVGTTAPLLTESGGSWGRLERQVRMAGALLVSLGPRAGLTYRWLTFPPPADRSDHEPWRRVLALYGRMVRLGVEEGELRGDLDVAAAVRLVAGVWGLAALDWARGTTADPGALAADQLELAFGGFRA